MTVADALTHDEQVKYERTWALPEYRHANHGLTLLQGRPDLFPSMRSCLDIGCGNGRLFATLNEQGIDAWGVDIATNSLDPLVMAKWGKKFLTACLWEMEWHRRFHLGVCTDVMEHIPPSRVMATLRAIASCCDEVIFKIAHSPNQLGGAVLHLTLQPAEWWMERMREVGGQTEYLGIQVRSGCEDSLIRWRCELPVKEPACLRRSCLIVGSAPNANLDGRHKGYLILAANGGAALARKAGLTVSVLVTTAYLFRPDASSQDIAIQNQLHGGSAVSVWADTKCGPERLVLDGLERLHFEFLKLRGVTPVQRSRVTMAAVGIDRWISTGVWAACLAVASGARHVAMTGFSLSPGHAGMAWDGTPRHHVAEDRDVMGLLVEHHGVEMIP